VKREVVSGQERVLWNAVRSLPAREFDFSDPEIGHIKTAIQMCDSYNVNADRRWLESVLDMLFSMPALLG
jgi:hypothetical protein